MSIRISRRLRGLVRKEFVQIRRDPSSLAIAFLLPALLLLLFGYGVSLDAYHVRVGVVVTQPTAETASFTSHLQHSPYFAPVALPDIQAAERAIGRREISAILWLREDFTRKLLASGGAPIGVMLDGVDANTARIVEGYLQQTWQTWLAARAAEVGQPVPGATISGALAVTGRVWFNPAVQSRDYLVPGLIAVIMTLTGALLTALVIAREWERGTLEALMVTPVSLREIIVSKLAPYFVLGMGGMAVSVAMAVWLFHVPLRGSFAVLVLAASLFMGAALGMGLLISSVARNQFVAGQIAIIVTFLPAFILSGFIFDIGSMPEPIRLFTYLVAARYFVAILQSVFLAGDVWSVILPNAAALVAMAAIFLGLARLVTRKRLD